MKNNDYRPLVPVNPAGLDKIAESLLISDNGDKGEQEQTTLSKIAVAVNRSDYIIVPQHSLLIAKYEADEFKGLKWENKDKPQEGVHYKLHKKGLQMPTPLQFMTHFNNVLKAHKGNGKLLDGNGRALPQNEVEDLYKHLTTKYINNGAWTWLNAKFVEAKGIGFEKLDLETVIKVNADGTLKMARVPLQPCLWKDGYATFAMNQQGLLTTEAVQQNYVVGENLYFHRPGQNCVARFNANSGWAGLLCYRNPSYSDAGLGVFACAEGAAPKNGGL